ncbi:hypothetical protein AAHC03_016554 [Spirometra sp. Aus1]
MNDLRTSLLTVAPIDGTTLEACQRSNKEIWKTGLSYDSRELDVVFGELRPEHFFLSGVNPKLMDAYCRSIVIPKSRVQIQGQGANGDGSRSLLPKRDGLQLAKSIVYGEKGKHSTMENQRFKAYLRKYFPHDNVVVQPMDQIMQNFQLAVNLPGDHIKELVSSVLRRCPLQLIGGRTKGLVSGPLESPGLLEVDYVREPPIQRCFKLDIGGRTWEHKEGRPQKEL